MVAFGIDLGTSNARAALLRGRTPYLVPDSDGSTAIPAVVGLEPGAYRIGRSALARAAMHPGVAVRGVKWWLGRAWDDAGLSRADVGLGREQPSAPFSARFARSAAGGGVTLLAAGDAHAPEDIAARLLAHLAFLAEHQGGERPLTAVLTAPPWLGLAGRTALGEAARRAGLTVDRMISDATATALTLPAARQAMEQVVAIVDVGAGGVSASVLTVRASQIVLVASTGDERTGGEAVDRALAALCRHDLGLAPGEGDAAGISELLRQTTESLKRDLSEIVEAAAVVPFLRGAPVLTLDRARVDGVLVDLLRRLEAVCNLALDDAGLSPSQITTLHITGGMGQVPAVRARVEGVFGRPPILLHPSTGSVALGAAILSGMLAGDIPNTAVVELTSLVRAAPVGRLASTPLSPWQSFASAPPPLRPPPASVPPGQPRSGPPYAISIVPPRGSLPPSSTSSPLLRAASAPSSARPLLGPPSERSVPPLSQRHSAPPPAPNMSLRPAIIPPPRASSPNIAVPLEVQLRKRAETQPQHEPVRAATPAVAPSTPPSARDRERAATQPSMPAVRPPSLRPSDAPRSPSRPPEMHAGRFTRPADPTEVLRLAVARPVHASDLAPVALPVLLTRVLAREHVRGVLTLEHGGKIATACVLHGRACLSRAEHAAFTQAFAWPNGTFTFEPAEFTVGLRSTFSMVRLAVDGLRVLGRSFTPEEIEAALGPRLDLAPTLRPDGARIVTRFGLTGGEMRLVEHGFDGIATGRSLERAGLGRHTTLELLLLLTLFDTVRWNEPRAAAHESAAEAIDARARKMLAGNHFEALGVHWSASPHDIDDAYRALRAKLAPGGEWAAVAPEICARMLERVEAAHATLRDPAKRIAHRRAEYPVDYEAVADLMTQRADALAMKARDVEAEEDRGVAAELTRTSEAGPQRKITMEALLRATMKPGGEREGGEGEG